MDPLLAYLLCGVVWYILLMKLNWEGYKEPWEECLSEGNWWVPILVGVCIILFWPTTVLF